MAIGAWGLDEVFKPTKTFLDPVHGDIPGA